MNSSDVVLPSINPLALARAFVAGALAVLLFQLGLSAILSAASLSPFPIYPMAPVPPFGVPMSLNWSFWGGLWGMIVWLFVREQSGPRYWITAILFGAFMVSAVLFFIVFPLKGQPIAAGWDMRLWAVILSLHAAFGLGCAVFFRLLRLTAAKR